MKLAPLRRSFAFEARRETSLVPWRRLDRHLSWMKTHCARDFKLD